MMRELIDELATFTRHKPGCRYETPVITVTQESNGNERRTEVWSNPCTCKLLDILSALRDAAIAAEKKVAPKAEQPKPEQPKKDVSA